VAANAAAESSSGEANNAADEADSMDVDAT